MQGEKPSSVSLLYSKAKRIQNEATRDEEDCEIFFDVLENGDDRSQHLAANFLCQFYHLFPNLHKEIRDIIAETINKCDSALRLTLVYGLRILAQEDSTYRGQFVDLLLQLLSWSEERVKTAAQQALSMLFQRDTEGMLVMLKDSLSKEVYAKNRNAIFDALPTFIESIQANSSSEEILKILWEIFRDELFYHSTLSTIDSVIYALGVSPLMQDLERQQAVANLFLSQIKFPSRFPSEGEKQEIDKILVRVTIVRQMCTILSQLSDEANSCLAFLCENMECIVSLPEDRRVRILRSACDIASLASSTLDEDSVEDLVDFISQAIPSLERDEDDDSAGEWITPRVDYELLEPLMLALYKLRRGASRTLQAVLDRNGLKSRFSLLLRFCHMHSSETKMLVETLKESGISQDLKIELLMCTNVGQLALSCTNSSHQVNITPSWKEFKLPLPVLPRTAPTPQKVTKKTLKIDRVKPHSVSDTGSLSA